MERFKQLLRSQRMGRAALGAGAALMLGSCGGMLLSSYTTSGMNDFYSHAVPASGIALAPEPGLHARLASEVVAHARKGDPYFVPASYSENPAY